MQFRILQCPYEQLFSNKLLNNNKINIENEFTCTEVQDALFLGY